jgi:hypothetical protein
MRLVFEKMDNTFFIFIMFRYGVSGIRKELYIWSVLNMTYNYCTVYIYNIYASVSGKKDFSSPCLWNQLGLIFSSEWEAYSGFENCFLNITEYTEYQDSVQSSELGPPTPSGCCPPPLAPKGGHTRLKSEGGPIPTFVFISNTELFVDGKVRK